MPAMRRARRWTVAAALLLITSTTGLQAPAMRQAPRTLRHATLDSTVLSCGASRPKTALSNDEISEFVDTSDEWISQRTGIRSRRVLQPGESIADHAASAAQKALDRSGLDPAEIGLVIVATSTPEDLFGDAANVADQCGCKNAVGFDITAACSGFLFALVTASQFLESGTYDAALVVGADAMSRWVDWGDRNTCILFGDGAGAVAIKKGGAGLLGFSMGSNGAGREKLALPYNGNRLPLIGGKSATVVGPRAMLMEGRSVYVFAATTVPRVLREALEDAHLTTDDVDWFLLHQANERILEAVADRIGVPKDKFIINMDENGNTSAASIPLALDFAVKSGSVKKGDVLACAGFGAGLSWGAAIFRWEGELQQ